MEYRLNFMLLKLDNTGVTDITISPIAPTAPTPILLFSCETVVDTSWPGSEKVNKGRSSEDRWHMQLFLDLRQVGMIDNFGCITPAPEMILGMVLASD
jgi:hypothetical protein